METSASGRDEHPSVRNDASSGLCTSTHLLLHLTSSWRQGLPVLLSESRGASLASQQGEIGENVGSLQMRPVHRET